MVFVWSNLTDGDPNFTLSQVALNDTIMVFACPDRGVSAWPVFDHGAMDDVVPLRRPLHCRAGDCRPTVAAIVAGPRRGDGGCAHAAELATDLAHRAAGDAGAVVRISG